MPRNYTREFKKKIVHFHLEEGRTIKSLVAEYGVSKTSVSTSLFSKILQHGKYIARSTARICFKQRISLRTHSIFCKIYQQFSKCCYIKLFHIGFSLHTLRHNDIIFFKIYNGFSIAHKTDLIRFERCIKCCTEYLLSIIQKNFH